MKKVSKSPPKLKLRTHIADIGADGVLLINGKSLRLAVAVPDRGRKANAYSTCLPGKTYPGSWTVPGEPDQITDQVFD
jgi:hypothetical protein